MSVRVQMRQVTQAVPTVLRRLFVMLLLVYLGFGIVLVTLQGRYIFYPDPTPFAQCPELTDAQQVTYGGMRGYMTLRSAERVVVFYHGNAGRACDRFYMEGTLAEGDASTLMVEYTGYAEAKGDPSMEALLGNVTDTVAYLEEQGFSEVIVVGESVGTGPAAYHAHRTPIAGLILITAYTDLASVAKAQLPLYPVRLLLRHNFTPVSWLSDYSGPVSVILAEHDEVVPTYLGEALFNSIPSHTKVLHIVPNSGHNTIYESEVFYDVLRASLR